MRLRFSASVGVAFLALLALGTGCKHRRSGAAAEIYVPPPRTASSMYSLGSICSPAAKESFDGAPAYAKGSDKPTKIAFFRKYTDDKNPSYDNLVVAPFTGTAAEGTAEEVQLVGCLDVTKEPGEPSHCGYYGGEVLIHTMKNTLRVYEAKTGKMVHEEEFVLDHKTGRCDSIRSFPKGVTSIYEGIDVGPKVASSMMQFQPANLKLAPATVAKLDDVCAGSAVPEAPAYVAGTPTKVHTVYFPDTKRSFTRQSLPKNMPEADKYDGDASEFALVACVVGQPKKKKNDCEFTNSKVLGLYDGDFAVKVIEARTGKLVETKSFKGSSPQGCPMFHDFWGQRDEVMTQIEPAFGKYVATYEGRYVAPTVAASSPKRRVRTPSSNQAASGI